MDSQSPPKRMTRARAAAKATDSTITKTAKIVTASARAKASKPVTTTTTATKRKLRSEDDNDDMDELGMGQPEQAVAKTTRPRGRPKKAVEPEVVAEESKGVPGRHTRGRATKKAAEPPKPEPVKPVRATRTRKTAAEKQEEAEVPTAAAKKPTRARAGTITKPAVKKTVTFEEPEKENIAPVPAKKTAASKPADTKTGLNARPVRRAASTAKPKTATRTAAKETKPAAPLSPRKVTQVRVARDYEDSGDELGMDSDTPMKPLMKSPIKPPASMRDSTAISIKPSDTVQNVTKAAALPVPDAPTVLLGSPIRPPVSPLKDRAGMKSPAKRMPGAPVLSHGASDAEQPAASPFKMSLFQTPAKRPAVPMRDLEPRVLEDNTTRSPLKMSLFQSPPKRPVSPMKQQTSPSRSNRTPAPKPTLLATPAPLLSAGVGKVDEQMNSQDDELQDVLATMDENATIRSPTRLRFPGRLSAVLPRHADPVLNADESACEAADDEDTEPEDEAGDEQHDFEDPMDIDEPEVQAPASTTTTPPKSPPKALGMFGLRQKDMDPYHGLESEDELATQTLQLNFYPQGVPATPCPAGASRTPKSAVGQRTGSNSTAKRARTDDFGFTPLANQLTGWAARSPVKDANRSARRQTLSAQDVVVEEQVSLTTGASPKQSFFEDEMVVRPEEPEVAAEQSTGTPDVLTPIFDDVPITQEDVALAAEANEMSLMDTDEINNLVNADNADDSESEASQEYADENAIPIDPVLLELNRSAGIPPVTPQRVINRTFHTTSKVPLKPADDSTPRSMKNRRHSISRLPTAVQVQRPTHGLTRNATVISYSPSKRDRHQDTFDEAVSETHDDDQSRAGSVPPVTPSKSEANWTTIDETPARTPRRDVNTTLLRGAVVFVDVHTSEGADASSLFVELLTQMGAKCLKSWAWNPNSEDGANSSRIGITHVVYKDGGKRTMEKVRATAGVVQCVGVAWVLDCERENKWLDEAPYYVDTSLLPRGGARRRKSMEPKALASLNSTTPARSGNPGPRQSHTAPSTPANGRRGSSLWMRTPEDESLEPTSPNNDETDWDMGGMLTPVPKTPAPADIARFAANVTPDTPSEWDQSSDELIAAGAEQLAMRTCPPKQRSAYPDFEEMGAGVLAREKDQGVMMRLMAARRKSLQFAPKVGSPLSKAWN